MFSKNIYIVLYYYYIWINEKDTLIDSTNICVRFDICSYAINFYEL